MGSERSVVTITDFIGVDPVLREYKDIISQGYTHDLYVMFPHCMVSDDCRPLKRRGYILCSDNSENRCSTKMVQSGLSCMLGEYIMKTREITTNKEIDTTIVIIPGNNQVEDLYQCEGIASAVIGIACPPDLKEGKDKVEHIGSKAFLVPTKKQKQCYENDFKNGFDSYLKTLSKAIDYINNSKAAHLTLIDFLTKNNGHSH